MTTTTKPVPEGLTIDQILALERGEAAQLSIVFVTTKEKGRK